MGADYENIDSGLLSGWVSLPFPTTAMVRMVSEVTRVQGLLVGLELWGGRWTHCDTHSQLAASWAFSFAVFQYDAIPHGLSEFINGLRISYLIWKTSAKRKCKVPHSKSIKHFKIVTARHKLNTEPFWTHPWSWSPTFSKLINWLSEFWQCTGLVVGTQA